MPLFMFVATSALVFGIGDFTVIPLVMRPLFKAALGDSMLDTLRLGPAAAFYVIHLAGIAWFCGRPAVAGGSAPAALRDGAILGFVAYSCYDMTSWTIMRDWTPALAAMDMAWGATISGASAWAGARATEAVIARRPARPRPPQPSC
jgi:uncharacterized membrane protein